MAEPYDFPAGAELRLWYAHSCGGQGYVFAMWEKL